MINYRKIRSQNSIIIVTCVKSAMIIKLNSEVSNFLLIWLIRNIFSLIETSRKKINVCSMLRLAGITKRVESRREPFVNHMNSYKIT